MSFFSFVFGFALCVSNLAIFSLYTYIFDLKLTYCEHALPVFMLLLVLVRVYIGSFWSEPLKNPDTKSLMEVEMGELQQDLGALPRMGAVRKVNDMVKRIRQVLVHTLLLDHLRKKMPSVFGKDKRKKELLDSLAPLFRDVMKEHDLPYGDFPDIHKFHKALEGADFTKLPKKKGKRMNQGKRVTDLQISLKVAIPDLLTRLPGISTLKIE